MAPDIRPCPFCAEDIKAAAIVCKHCQREMPRQRWGFAGQPAPKQRASNRGFAKFIFWCVAGFFVVAVIIGNNSSPKATNGSDAASAKHVSRTEAIQGIQVTNVTWKR